MLTVESAVEQVVIAYKTGAQTGDPFMYPRVLPKLYNNLLESEFYPVIL
jgi:hypothetical protein